MTTTDIETQQEARVPLSKERVLLAAVGLADRGGIDAVTMRKLANELGVEAMSLYYHVANKDALLDGMTDVVVAEIEKELGGFEVGHDESDWQQTLRHRILTARKVMLRHPWAPAIFETRTAMSPTLMRYFDAVLGIMREGGFSYDLAHHAMHVLGSRALGFDQELFAPDDTEAAEDDASEMMEAMAEQLPYLVGMMTEIVPHTDDPEDTLGWCDDQTEFEFALDLILDGLKRLQAAQ